MIFQNIGTNTSICISIYHCVLACRLQQGRGLKSEEMAPEPQTASSCTDRSDQGFPASQLTAAVLYRHRSAASPGRENRPVSKDAKRPLLNKAS